MVVLARTLPRRVSSLGRVKMMGTRPRTADLLRLTGHPRRAGLLSLFVLGAALAVVSVSSVFAGQSRPQDAPPIAASLFTVNSEPSSPASAPNDPDGDKGSDEDEDKEKNKGQPAPATTTPAPSTATPIPPTATPCPDSCPRRSESSAGQRPCRDAYCVTHRNHQGCQAAKLRRGHSHPQQRG